MVLPVGAWWNSFIEKRNHILINKEKEMAEFKQWRNEDRTYLKDVIPLDTPYNLKVEVSSLCNARCIYCAHSKMDHGVYEGNMSQELMDRILTDSKEFPHRYKVMEMFFWGINVQSQS